MAGTMIETLTTNWSIVRPGGNSTAASAPTQASRFSTSAPTGDGAIAWGHQGAQVSNGLKLLPYGVGADTNTFLMYAFAWHALPGVAQSGGAIGTLDLWTAVLLASFTCEIDSGLPGLVNTQLGTTQYFCSAITLGTGNSGISVEVLSPGHGSFPAHILLDAKGARYVTLEFNMNSSATSANCLYGRI